ncbi:MAG TPA: adenylate/guanylate cyclase domain-containing protein [Gaiellaceae bacterium]
MTCPACGAANEADARFCNECGASLASGCPACGVVNAAGARFCKGCGAPLGAAAAERRVVESPVAERRLVTVLFADLVGFTTLSEGRDAEEVRELLSRYFEAARRLIELYGGTVEKFIGDAVMAVWGVPAATEDDAERAVRAGLDLVAAVSALGEEAGGTLRARAGVLTGEAAVTLGASGQGMVAGDIVNTASRVQSAAEPGSVLVGEATRRASEQAIAYEPAGSHELKGKEGTTELWRALRVVSGRGGALKSSGLEAPFTGRDRELRQIKELFHVSADEQRAQLVSVTGIAGIGKSRLAWEFYKYFDGLEQVVYWHRGRCLAYGEGVAYWALADMVRMRCGISEDDAGPVAEQKLQAALEEHLLDADERRFVGPRLAQLLGLGEQTGLQRQDLHAAWRLFFERLSDTYPCVLVFEDMQWADSSLLDFVEHLLDWSRDHPLFVVTLARPELLEKRAGWGGGQRHFSSLYLEPLPPAAMQQLLAGLVPGLPEGLRDRIMERAEGIPLYAVETVRMLLDRGLLTRDGASYRVVGEVESLAVPETLQALAAARLDGLSADERRIVQDGAVLGKTFTPTALAALSGHDPERLDSILAGLVRKELLGVQADPRSPEHGQYGFLQDLLRQIAYDTLARRDRRAKHLVAAEHLTTSLGEDEVAEVIASHLLEAYRLDPDAPDAGPLRERARAVMLTAAERAAALGATAEAYRLYEQAAELAEEPTDQAAALLEAGRLALRAGMSAAHAVALLERAEQLYTAAGDRHGAARAAAQLSIGAEVSLEAALERLERSYATIADDEPSATHAELLSRLANSYFFHGDHVNAADRVERALDLAEALRLPEFLVRGWVTKASLALPRRPQETHGLYRLARDTALAHDLLTQAITCCAQLSDISFHTDRYAESITHQEQALALCRRTGNRRNEWFALSEQTYALTMLGRWDESLARLAELPDDQLGSSSQLLSPLTGPLEIHLERGELAEAQSLLARFEELDRADDVQARAAYVAGVAAVRRAEGRPREALAAAEEAIASREFAGLSAQSVKQGYRHALEAALALGEPDTVERLLELVEQTPIGLRPPFLAALAHRYRARLADGAAAEAHHVDAVAGFRGLDLPFDEAVSALEYGEWLVAQGRPGEAETQLTAARETFEALRAVPWIERAARVSSPEAAAV